MYLHLRIDSMSGILVTGNGTDEPTSGCLDTISATPTLTRDGSQAIGSIGEAAGTGSPGTGDVSSKTFCDAVRSEIGPYRRPLQRYLALPKIIRDATPNEKFLSLNRWRKPGEVL